MLWKVVPLIMVHYCCFHFKMLFTSVVWRHRISFCGLVVKLHARMLRCYRCKQSLNPAKEKL